MTIKAESRGVLFDKVDCYVLEDGKRVIGIGGMMSGIGATGGGGLRRYLDRLPNRFGILSSRPAIMVSLPKGGLAKCFEADYFIDVCSAYVDARDTGEIHPNQIPMAIAASGILRACSKVGISALIDEATGYQSRRAPEELRNLFDRFLRETPIRWDLKFKRSFTAAVCRLYGWSTPRSNQSMPHQMASIIHKLYKTMWGDLITKELKQRNPNPRFGSNHHLFLQELPRTRLSDDLLVAETLAKTSHHPSEFWKRMENHFDTTQMTLF